MGTTEQNDAADREKWRQCMISHNAALRWIKKLVDENYTTLPNPL